MKKKIIMILVLIFIITIAIIGFIFVKNNNNKLSNNEIKSNEVKGNEIINNDKNSITENNEVVTQENKLDIKLSIANTWSDGIKEYAQYTVNLSNNSSETIKNWKVLIDITDIEITQVWNAKYEINGSILKLIPESYNNEVQQQQKIELGFIAKSDFKQKLENIKTYSGEQNVNTNNNNNNEIKENKEKNDILTNKTTGQTQSNVPQKNENKSNDKTSKIENNILIKIMKKGATEVIKEINSTPVGKHGKLSVEGTKIVDKNKQEFQLKGVSTHSIAIYSQYINEETFKEMRDNWNINVIRIAMYSNPNDGYTKELHSKVKEAVNYATDLGLYVIIDWHILQDNNPNTYKNEAISFFEEMANEFKNNKNVLYEICNEPNGDVTWDKDIKPYAEEVISKIRAIDTNAIIIVGTPKWSQDIDIVANNPITDYENIMYTLHFYAATHKDELRKKLKIAHEKGLPIFVTEFGISDASGNGTISQEEGDKWIELLNSYNISWVCWNLSNKNETSAILNSNCNKTTDFQESDFSQQGKWLLKKLK
ncbi:endoglucanase [Clostridium sp. CAG:492]|nr:endoglucanase [Clostridium sp. CAG:492]